MNLGMNSIRIAIACVVLAGCSRGQDELPLSLLKLPDGFQITLYARVPNARSLAMGKEGTLFVGTRGNSVYAVQDTNGDGSGDRVTVIAKGLRSPNGVASRDGSLYVAEISRVLRYDDIERRLENPPEPAVINDSFPTDRHHGWKYIAFGPDGLLYIPVGMPCNVCNPKDDRYGTIIRMRPDGSDLEIFARGIRNTVGFDWNPETDVLWFTDNGRDWLGDDRPPDELNRAPEKGLHFGFPFIHGQDISDPEFGNQAPDMNFVPPALDLGPHVAALGMRFYTGKQFPAEYHNQIFIAEHGSWNRSVPIGYRIMRVEVQGKKAIAYEVFVEGWLQGGKPWGRPVDVLVAPDGALLVSDDHAGAIYRISYSKTGGL